MNLCWNGLDKGWQASFNKGWEAYILGNPPIGAAILDSNNKLISFGRHRIFDRNGDSGSLYGTNLSHAAVNAILQVGSHPNKDVMHYTLYSTVELCPLCFGAVIMSGIKRIKFGAIDRLECICGLHQMSDLMTENGIYIDGPVRGIQDIQAALQTCYEMEQGRLGDNTLIDAWRSICPMGVKAGIKLYKSGALFGFIENGITVNEVIDYVCRII